MEHIVSVGHIVAWGWYYSQWQQVYDQSFIQKYSFANCIGNHEAMTPEGGDVISGRYNAICANYPLNGQEKQQGTSFYYLYNNALFLYLTYWENVELAQQWAGRVLASMEG